MYIVSAVTIVLLQISWSYEARDVTTVMGNN